MKLQFFGAAVLAFSSVAASATTYTSDPAFTLAATGTTLTSESFEGAPVATATSLDFGTVKFNCTGSSWCPGFFGQSSIFATDGTLSVYFATPDTATFTFGSAITTFGVDVIGMGDVGTTTFSVDYGTGPINLLTGYSAPGGTVTFAGIIDSAGFTTVTFSGTAPNDGIFFDRLRFGGTPGGAVPEVSTWAMMLVGLGAAGAGMRRRKRAQLHLA